MPKKDAWRPSPEPISCDAAQRVVEAATKHGTVARLKAETSSPVTGAFAEFERAMIRQRIHAGLKRAVANGKTLGRPLNNPKAIEKARQALGNGMGINEFERVGLSNSTVARLKAEMMLSKE